MALTERSRWRCGVPAGEADCTEGATRSALGTACSRCAPPAEMARLWRLVGESSSIDCGGAEDDDGGNDDDDDNRGSCGWSYGANQPPRLPCDDGGCCNEAPAAMPGCCCR